MTPEQASGSSKFVIKGHTRGIRFVMIDCTKWGFKRRLREETPALQAKQGIRYFSSKTD